MRGEYKGKISFAKKLILSHDFNNPIEPKKLIRYAEEFLRRNPTARSIVNTLSDFVLFTVLKAIEESTGLRIKYDRAGQRRIKMRSKKLVNKKKCKGRLETVKVEIRVPMGIKEQLKKLIERGISISYLVNSILAAEFGVKDEVRKASSRWKANSNKICIKVPKKLHKLMMRKGKPAKIATKILEDIALRKIEVKFD